MVEIYPGFDFANRTKKKKIYPFTLPLSKRASLGRTAIENLFFRMGLLGPLSRMAGKTPWKRVLLPTFSRAFASTPARTAVKTTAVKTTVVHSARVAKVRVKEVDLQGRAHATGRRKAAVARVWIKPGDGSMVVNGKPHTEYFCGITQRGDMIQPFFYTQTLGKFDVWCLVKGGGFSGSKSPFFSCLCLFFSSDSAKVFLFCSLIFLFFFLLLY